VRACVSCANAQGGKKMPLERPKYLCTVKIPPDCSKISVPKNSQYGI